MTGEQQWRQASACTDTGCVSLAALPDGIGVRNSRHPDAGALVLGRPVMVTWLDAVRAGHLDDLTA
jgi:hypothetical protein